VSDVQTGDVVRLKSGGPKMVADEIEEDPLGGGPRVSCEWFNEKNMPCKKVFALTSVEKVQANAES
jgi:uncharacterized protein YodC (DUF2158 family)